MDDVDRDTVRGAGFSDGEIIEIVPRPGPRAFPCGLDPSGFRTDRLSPMVDVERLRTLRSDAGSRTLRSLELCPARQRPADLNGFLITCS